MDLADLWHATAVRPLAAAVADIDPAQRALIDPLLGDGPLPATLRRLARAADVRDARAVEVLARRLRQSLGRLARSDDPVLAAAVPERVDSGLLCALVLTVSTAATAPADRLTTITRSGQVDVPGFPASTVDDPAGPWQRARADAIELGADLSLGGSPALLVPTSWLGRGRWPALWARAHRRRAAMR
jgi:hypothetical protein